MDIIFRVFIESIEENIAPILGLAEAKKAIKIVASGKSCDCINNHYDFIFTINYLAEKLGYTTELIVNGVVVDFKLIEKPTKVKRRTRGYLLSGWLPSIAKSLVESNQ